MVHMSTWKRIKNEISLIRRYRETSLVPECDATIEDIVNECVVSDTEDRVVNIDLRETDLSDSIQKKIHDEFETHPLLNEVQSELS